MYFNYTKSILRIPLNYKPFHTDGRLIIKQFVFPIRASIILSFKLFVESLNNFN